MGIVNEFVLMPPEINTGKIYSFIMEYDIIKWPTIKWNADTKMFETSGLYVKLPFGEINLNYNMTLGSNIENIKGISIIIKSLITGREVASYRINVEDSEPSVTKLELTESNLIVKKIPIYNDQGNISIKPGSFYKIQMAFIDNNNNVGYYTSPITFVATLKPLVSLECFGQKILGMIGTLQEGLESSYYILKNLQQEIIWQSKTYSYTGETKNKILDTIFDSDTHLYEINLYENIDYYTQEIDLEYELDFMESYILEWHYKLTNGYEDCHSMEIINTELMLPDFYPYDLDLNLDRDNGLIEINLINSIKDQINNLKGAKLEFFRSSKSDEFKIWKKIKTIEINQDYKLPYGKNLVLKDWDIKYGETYRYGYAIISNNKDYNNYIFKSNNTIQAWFEDSFLYDENQQLCFRYNPKVSSFKSNTKDTKIETIGGQYPIFYRNEAIEYKEFQLSGLLSYHSDKNNLFFSDYLPDELTTNLSDINLLIEQKFKKQVYDWLNNGKVKKLKTPAEGTYVVRLQSVSLSPNDQLSRMLHTFSANAVEVNGENLNWQAKSFINLEKQNNLFPLGVYSTEEEDFGRWTCYFDNNPQVSYEEHIPYSIGELVISSPQFDRDDKIRIGQAEWIYDPNSNIDFGTGTFQFTEAGLRMPVQENQPIIGLACSVPCEIWAKGQKYQDTQLIPTNIKTLSFDKNLEIIQLIDESEAIYEENKGAWYKSITFVSKAGINSAEFQYIDMLNKETTKRVVNQVTYENVYFKFININSWFKNFDQIYGVRYIEKNLLNSEQNGATEINPEENVKTEGEESI